MADHGSRSHARWAASSTARNWACPGALTLVESIATPEKENKAAAWGTACHQVAEACLRQNIDAAQLIGTVQTTKEHRFEVDEEMADTAQMYVDYVQSSGALASKLHIEQRFSLDALDPPYEAGGTADAVIYDGVGRHIEVVDLKGGRGVVVEVEDNKQLRTYALGVMLANPGLDVDTVTVTIVQPRAAHKDGRIRSETFRIAELVEWTADLLAAMRRAKQAENDFVEKPLAAWTQEYLSAGEHCKFCRAAGICPALEQRAMDAAGVWFDDLDQPRISNAPSAMSPEELSKKLDLLDVIAEWMNAVRATAQQQAEGGVVIPNYQLSETIGHRKFTDEDQVKVLLCMEAGVSDDDLYTRKFKSPAQVEKLLGAKRLRAVKDKLDALTVRPVTGTNLVRATKTTRPAVQPAVNRHFDVIEG